MPLLDRNGAKDDVWQLADARDIDNLTHVLLRWDDAKHGLPAALADRHTGVVLPNDTRIDAVLPLLHRLALIAIPFPAHGDGRGFSLARQLRDAGFTGILRASGPLIPDQFAYALACGFDEIDLPEASANRQPVGQWLEASTAMSATYQRGYGERRNILDQRRAARAELPGGQ